MQLATHLRRDPQARPTPLAAPQPEVSASRPAPAAAPGNGRGVPPCSDRPIRCPSPGFRAGSPRLPPDRSAPAAPWLPAAAAPPETAARLGASARVRLRCRRCASGAAPRSPAPTTPWGPAPRPSRFPRCTAVAATPLRECRGSPARNDSVASRSQFPRNFLRVHRRVPDMERQLIRRRLCAGSLTHLHSGLLLWDRSHTGPASDCETTACASNPIASSPAMPGYAQVRSTDATYRRGRCALEWPWAARRAGSGGAACRYR